MFISSNLTRGSHEDMSTSLGSLKESSIATPLQ